MKGTMNRCGVLRVVGLKTTSTTSLDDQQCFDISIDFDCSTVLNSDLLDDTVNYVPLAKLLKNSRCLSVPLDILQTLAKGLSPLVSDVCVRNQSSHTSSESRRPATPHSLSNDALKPVFTVPVSVFAMYGWSDVERTRKQPINVALGIKPHEAVTPADVEDMRKIIIETALSAQCRTIERICAVIAQAISEHFPTLSDFCLRFQKPEIGLLTNMEMQYASFEFRHGSSYAPISRDLLGKDTFKRPPHGLCSMNERAHQQLILHQYSSEYLEIGRFLTDNLQKDFATLESKGVAILDVGAGNGSIFRMLQPTVTKHVQRYVAYEPNIFLLSKLRETAESFLPTGASVALHDDIFTLHNTHILNKTKFDLVFICHSLYIVDREDVIPLLRTAFSFLCPGGQLILVHRAESLFPHVEEILSFLRGAIVQSAKVVDAAIDLRKAPTDDQVNVVCCVCGSSCSVPEEVNACLSFLTSNNNILNSRMLMLALTLPNVPDASVTVEPLQLKNKYASMTCPLAVHIPQNKKEVQEIIASENAAGRSVTIVGGGHSDRCQQNNAVTLSLSKMRSVTVDVRAREAVVQGGATSGDLCAVLDPLGLMVPLGSCLSVGQGLALHGGVGHFTFLHGLSCDFIVGAEIVLPNGRLIKIHENNLHDDMERDIVFALRGCGSIVGVVLELVLRCVDFVPLCTDTELLQTEPLGSTDETLMQGTIVSYLSKNQSVAQDAEVADMCVAPDGKILRQRFFLPATNNNSDVHILKKYADVFEIELHNEFSKTDYDFKRSCALPQPTSHEECTNLGRLFSVAYASRPFRECYLHVLDCGDVQRTSSKNGTPLSSSCLSRRNWRYVVVIIGRWNGQDGAIMGCQVRKWVYAVVDSLVAASGWVLPTDLGCAQRRDLLLVPHSFYGEMELRALERLSQSLWHHSVSCSHCPSNAYRRPYGNITGNGAR